MNKLVLIGGGGHCRACIDVIEQEGKYSIIGILDSSKNKGAKILGYEVIGDDSDIPHFVTENCDFLITVGQITSAEVRVHLYNLIKNYNGHLATVISPRAYIAKSATVGAGTIIMHDALINSNAKIGENCIVNTKALVEHDCLIESHCHISTSAALNGDCKVGEKTFFGSNAVSPQGALINPKSFIKAGSCYNMANQIHKKVALLTTLYPLEAQIVIDFFSSVSSQSEKNFDIIVLNDGFSDFKSIKQLFSKLRIIELPSERNIAKNRESLIKYAKKDGYEIAIFADIDDTFSTNRVEVSIKELAFNDIVVNDLTSIKGDTLLNQNVYSERLSHGQFIDSSFILDKNIFGLSNTAINMNVVDYNSISFPKDLIAVDWYFFSSLLLMGARAKFISNVVTFYRQHDSNTVGLAGFTADKIRNILRVKKIHYERMSESFPIFKLLADELNVKSKLILDEKYFDVFLNSCTKNIHSPLWWELEDFKDL
ncbi:NeuD/PglB/VioB family sugar acetyltransferase [Shewanella sp. SM23]|uniref:NeuD/PglB/VioB family sugar acetyltransferase n=1 Tax=Shewanella sp. SM23 TaxID=2912794 RepID=UPI0021D9AD9B|nr:NeuD/PglB/VioB family sugar acetyltransferase [Shewanella sp. SM23]MCU8082691.1 NeuD/PglB/VioB family sugar acetyltransferase [Shewanella sp. SM23]